MPENNGTIVQSQFTDEDFIVTTHTGGTQANLYIEVNGVEVGSLFIDREADGRIIVTWGAYDNNREWWMAATPEHEHGAPAPATLYVPEVVVPDAPTSDPTPS